MRQVGAVFLAPACVQSAFSAADEELAIALYRRGASIVRASARYLAGLRPEVHRLLNHQTCQAITSLTYFVGLIDVAMEASIPYGYRVRRKGGTG